MIFGHEGLRNGFRHGFTGHSSLIGRRRGLVRFGQYECNVCRSKEAGGLLRVNNCALQWLNNLSIDPPNSGRRRIGGTGFTHQGHLIPNFPLFRAINGQTNGRICEEQGLSLVTIPRISQTIKAKTHRSH